MAGIGCRSDCSAAAIVGLVREASGRAGCTPQRLAGLASKVDGPGLREASHILGLPLVAVDFEAMQAVQSRCLTTSAAALAATGIASVAEAAALAAAGADATLLLPRIAAAGATCAIARGVGR